MTLPTTGSISLGQVITELSIPIDQISLNQTNVRILAGKSSGQISMSDLRGKSNGGSTGQYVSGGPYTVEAAWVFYGYSNSSWGVGGSRIGPPQAFGTGGHTVTAVLSDGGENFSITLSATNPVNPPTRCRIKTPSGTVLIDFPISQLVYSNDLPGYVSLPLTGFVFPTLSPVGTQYTVDLYT